MTAEPVCRVILRRWPKSEGGTVDAMLLDVDANRGRVVCYAHVGQHSEGDYAAVMSRTRPVAADDPDAVALLSELRSIGYNLRVVKRWPRSQRW